MDGGGGFHAPLETLRAAMLTRASAFLNYPRFLLSIARCDKAQLADRFFTVTGEQGLLRGSGPSRVHLPLAALGLDCSSHIGGRTLERPSLLLNFTSSHCIPEHSARGGSIAALVCSGVYMRLQARGGAWRPHPSAALSISSCPRTALHC